MLLWIWPQLSWLPCNLANAVSIHFDSLLWPILHRASLVVVSLYLVADVGLVFISFYFGLFLFMLALCFRSVFALWGFPNPKTRSSWMSWKWEGCVCLGRFSNATSAHRVVQKKHPHSRESNVLMKLRSDGVFGEALTGFQLCSLAGFCGMWDKRWEWPSDLYESYYLWDLWILMRLVSNLRLASCACVNAPRMFLRCMNKVSQMVRTADLRPWSSESVIPRVS